MKIKSVKWSNHSILGDLELDFTKENGDPFETILFAGENGTGKSTILDSLNTFLTIGSFENFEFIQYEWDGAYYTAIPWPDNPYTNPNFFQIRRESDEFIFQVNTDKYNRPNDIIQNAFDPRLAGCVYSKARSDYKTKEITSTGTSALDIDKYGDDEDDNYSSLIQLMVDVISQDYTDYSMLNQESGESPISWSEFYENQSNQFRFRNAFDSFFEKLKFKGVKKVNKKIEVVFTKEDTEIGINDLSTGEKQVVFRGSYLLKNNQSLIGGIIMVDEPEISMHPKWQKRILKYYKDLFAKNNSEQSVQLFTATHSTYVLEDALTKRDDHLTIVLKEENHKITGRKITAPYVLPYISNSETNYLAFDLCSNDFHCELYGFLQQRENHRTVKQTDDFIFNHPRFRPSIHIMNSSHGSTTYQTLPTYIRNIIHHPDSVRTFTPEQLELSTSILIDLCR